MGRGTSYDRSIDRWWEVLDQKLGMRREAHFAHDEFFKGEWADQLIYAILDEEWTARR
jgi:RimJ/RimL family protein N-acetyltransferase